MKAFYVYIQASKQIGTLYIGMTGNSEQRIYQHENKTIDGFTKDYNVDRLVSIEECVDIEAATTRERQLKEWRRSWKLELIVGSNPDWNDLATELFDWTPYQVRADTLVEVA